MDTLPLPHFSGIRYAGFGIAAFLVLASSMSAVRAQDQDSVNMRLDRLEQGLNDVQRQLNAGAAPAEGDTATPPPAASGNAALNTEVRLSNLESQMRDLTGQLEEVQYGISQTKARLDKMQADDEIRFHALEHPGSPPLAAAPSSSDASPGGGPPDAPPPGVAGDTGTPPDQSGGPTPMSPGGSSGDMSQAPSATGVLTAPGDAAPGAPPPDPGTQAPPPDQTAATPHVQLPSGSPESQYTYAFNLVRQNDYAGAEVAFKQFLDQNPQDPLAGNAQYWLGETYFARNQFQQAAAIFAQGYVKYPKSEKTPNVLLSLGISLGNLGKKQQACLSFAKLERQFPTMHQSIRDLERAQKKRLGCAGAAAAD